MRKAATARAAAPDEKAKTRAEVKMRLADDKTRLNSLYKITDKSGQVIPFRMNVEQELLFDEMHYLNLILKSRQVGGTTLISLFALDRGHKLEDGKKIFQTKILDPWRSMPQKVRRAATTESKQELVLDNGSAFRVTTSARSGTTQILHISEFGYTCARNPEKAKEIVTGSLNAVDRGQIVFIESTAMGRVGYFYQYCQEALRLSRMMKQLTSMEWKLFFFPWWQHPEYCMTEDETRLIVITRENAEYFEELAAKHGVQLNDRQKAWYVTKLQKQAVQEDMAREYPSYPEEAFKVSTEGSYYGPQMARMYADKRICSVPHDPSALVHTAWDLGRGDENPIVFFQTKGPWINIIDYYENQGEGLPHYTRILREKAAQEGYQYGQHFAPHDIEHHEYSTGNVRRDTAKTLGVKFTTIPRIKLDIEGVEAVRRTLPMVRIDEVKCNRLILCLENFRKAWDERNQVFTEHYVHDEYSHGAKAMESLAFGLKLGLGRESNVYQSQDRQITCRPFDHPANWKRCYGLSLGWDMSAIVWGCLDIEGDILYATAEYSQPDNVVPTLSQVITAKGKWIPGAIGAGDKPMSDEEDARVRSMFLNLGHDMQPDDSSIEAGILEVTNRLVTGRLVIFNTCTRLLDEYDEYRRTEKGQPPKGYRHLDALRHMVTTGIRFAISEAEAKKLYDKRARVRHVPGDARMGY